MGKGRCYADYADTVALLHALAHFAVLVRRVESSDQNGWNSPDRVVKRERRLPSLSLSHSLSHPLTRSFALIALRLFLHFIFLLFLCCFFFVAVFLLTFMRPAYHFVSSGRFGSGAELRALLVPFQSICTDLLRIMTITTGNYRLLCWSGFFSLFFFRCASMFHACSNMSESTFLRAPYLMCRPGA